MALLKDGCTFLMGTTAFTVFFTKYKLLFGLTMKLVNGST